MTPAEAASRLLPHHLGELHAYETVLVLVIAFGPFLVIVLLALRERRRGAVEEHPAGEDDGNGSGG